jgi:hypothetical protein
MGIDGQTAYVNTNKNRTEVVTEHACADRNTGNKTTVGSIFKGPLSDEQKKSAQIK